MEIRDLAAQLLGVKGLHLASPDRPRRREHPAPFGEAFHRTEVIADDGTNSCS